VSKSWANFNFWVNFPFNKCRKSKLEVGGSRLLDIELLRACWCPRGASWILCPTDPTSFFWKEGMYPPERLYVVVTKFPVSRGHNSSRKRAQPAKQTIKQGLDSQ